uniref:hypothetical protein n=1 Tax=Thaumasiovibrio occultus TaxID=1891184 RepID=UPI000B3537E0|nr:hypothetical protein [Thaumasiovibrio occultus]
MITQRRLLLLLILLLLVGCDDKAEGTESAQAVTPHKAEVECESGSEVMGPLSVVKNLFEPQSVPDKDSEGLPPLLEVKLPLVDELGVYDTAAGRFTIEISSTPKVLLEDVKIELYNQDGTWDVTEHFTYRQNKGRLKLKAEKEAEFQSYLADELNEIAITAFDGTYLRTAQLISFRYGMNDFDKLANLDTVKDCD